MKNLKIRKIKEKKLIGMKFRYYIDFIILSCCIIIAFNIHPSTKLETKDVSSETHTMTYIFHDYEGNEYIMNDYAHGASSSWDYLFDDEVPNDLKGDEQDFTDSVSLGDLLDEEKSDSNIKGGDIDDKDFDDIKDNQVSFDDILSELGLDSQDFDETKSNDDNESGSNNLVINIGDLIESTDKTNYYVKEEIGSGNTSSLIIEKLDDSVSNTGNQVGNEENIKYDEDNQVKNDNLMVAKIFTFVEEGRVLPTLVSRNDLYADEANQAIAYLNNSESNGIVTQNSEATKKSGITIVDDYEDCMTPRGYKIRHGDSVLAYKQMADTPDICNIERRFCWKGKLSGTYTQQGCSVNKDYTYEQRGDVKVVAKNDGKKDFKGGSRTNPDGSVTVKNSGIGGSFVFDRPNSTYSNFNDSDNNIKNEDLLPSTQEEKTYQDCITPRGEKVQHGRFIQAFKHANGFSDAPCEAQIRLCSMGELMGTYTESTCKTRDTSFIDWINGSPTRKTYSEEKLDLVRRQIEAEGIYYENARKDATRSTDSDALDRILWILDQE